MTEKKVTRKLFCKLTEQEYRLKSENLAQLLKNKSDLEISKAETAKSYKEQIDSVQHEINKQIPIVESGEEERDVECLIFYNDPEKGKKRIVRSDTNEEVAIALMTNEECADLFYNSKDDSKSAGSEPPKMLPEPLIAEAEIIEEKSEKKGKMK